MKEKGKFMTDKVCNGECGNCEFGKISKKTQVHDPVYRDAVACFVDPGKEGHDVTDRRFMPCSQYSPNAKRAAAEALELEEKVKQKKD